MPAPLIVIPALLVAAVLIASGVAKLRHPDDLSGWADLGVPAPLRRAWLLRFHPWGEIVLGLALALLGGIIGLLAAIIALALMIGYLVFVARIVSQGTDASCACFGARKKITPMTVTRNSWYVLLAALAVATTWATPLWGGPIAALDDTGWAWAAALAATAMTVILTMWPAPASDPAPASPQEAATASDDDELDYLRTRTPSLPLTLAGGETVDLRELSMRQPLLTLHLKPGCGSCVAVHDRVPEIRELLPELSVRVLLTAPPEASDWTETSEPQSLHDPAQYLRNSIAEWGTPTAVLFGMDGLLAGGPVTGYTQISAFIDDIYESLHGERPTPAFSAQH